MYLCDFILATTLSNHALPQRWLRTEGPISRWKLPDYMVTILQNTLPVTTTLYYMVTIPQLASERFKYVLYMYIYVHITKMFIFNETKNIRFHCTTLQPLRFCPMLHEYQVLVFLYKVSIGEYFQEKLDRNWWIMKNLKILFSGYTHMTL